MKDKSKSIVNVICNRHISSSKRSPLKTIPVYSGASVKAFVYTDFSIPIVFSTLFVLLVVFVFFRVEIPNELQIAFIEKFDYSPCYIRVSQLFLCPRRPNEWAVGLG